MSARTPALRAAVPATCTQPSARGRIRRPGYGWAEITQAPLHDFPIRDEILFQFCAFSPDAEVLEVGPGSGFTAFRLADSVRYIMLLDVAPRAIEELRGALGDRSNIGFVCADVSARGLAQVLGRTYDAAFGLDAFEYVNNPGVCLANLAAVLRPGGELFLTFPNVPPPAGDGVTWFTELAPLEAMLANAGFSSWHIFSVRRQRFAAAVYAVLHEWPLRLHRHVRAGGPTARPQGYDATWAFQNRKRLLGLKAGLHFYWFLLGWLLRLGSDPFVAEPIGDRPLGRQLVVRAMR